jgi:HK97 family phage prohead protease
MNEKMMKKQFRFKLDGTSVDEAGHFTGYASIFGMIDSYGDIVDKGAFKKTIRDRKRIKLLWSHDAFAPAIGYVELEEDEKGLRVGKGQLYLDIERAREAYVNMKNGTLDGLSIGYNVVKENIDRATNERHLKEISLWEVSLCNFQACPGAVVTDVKSRLDRLREDIEGIEEAEITPELRADLIKHIESLIALHGKAEPPAGTPETSLAEEPPADSGADDLRDAKDWRDFLASSL